jgi:hypothetical protein
MNCVLQNFVPGWVKANSSLRIGDTRALLPKLLSELPFVLSTITSGKVI